MVRATKIMPVAPAATSRAVGTGSGVETNPRVNTDEPASRNASPMVGSPHGMSSRAKATTNDPRRAPSVPMITDGARKPRKRSATSKLGSRTAMAWNSRKPLRPTVAEMSVHDRRGTMRTFMTAITVLATSPSPAAKASHRSVVIEFRIGTGQARSMRSVMSTPISISRPPMRMPGWIRSSRTTTPAATANTGTT